MVWADTAPVNPGPTQARDLLRQELAKPVYADDRSLTQRIWDWATEHLHTLLTGVGETLPAYVLAPALLILVAVVVYAATRLRRRRARPAATPAVGVLHEVDLTAEQLRQRAADAEALGDHAGAAVDFFRALARQGEERALLPPSPARTAHETGVRMTEFFPQRSSELSWAADVFDRVRYGHRSVDAHDVARLRDLDEQIRRERPVQHDLVDHQ
ncbi:DUF4129 domain-containing protein [Rudaeicoccus suwonensis]|uniref:Uncharacterized protein DUF4129 n=1 Tax=Rudaeicoccus suwonensis TaxID=657409 RepID=A0A561E8W3_9MICO|nr:DUF4129 domain-containing protein [Rudaeicoccus suwonensis]TWE12053.1 uncharacterized protein DUF4129 [Rudaeicoccus suwonensis]